MKKVWTGLAVVGAVLAAVLALGPRVAVETDVAVPSLPDDLDGYLAASEERFADIRPGAEKTIVWADSTHARTPIALVYLHGFSATRQEVRPLCDTLAARLGANLFYTRLTGHGRTDDAMAEATVNAWLRDGTEALAVGQRLGERVVVIGTSTGATLAAWLAAQPAHRDLQALVLISPNFFPKDDNVRFLLWPWGEAIAEAVVGPYHTWEPRNDAQAQYWTTRYPSEALVTMMGLVDLVEEADLGAVQTPTLVLYSPNDQVVDPQRIEARFPTFGAAIKHLVAVDSAGDASNHVLAGAILSPDNTGPMADTILAFLHPVLLPPAP